MTCAVTSTFIVLCGKTGSGKTAILEALGTLGYPVIHLEKIASHRGSAFGHILLAQQPSQKEFEEQLKKAVAAYSAAPYVFLEQKSPSIGKRKIPDWFYLQMTNGIFIELDVDEAIRIQNIQSIYGSDNTQGFSSGLQKLTKRLPLSVIEEAQALLHAGNNSKFIQLMLCYYDQTNGYSNYKKPAVKITSTDNNYANMASQILSALRQAGLTFS